MAAQACSLRLVCTAEWLASMHDEWPLDVAIDTVRLAILTLLECPWITSQDDLTPHCVFCLI